MFPRIPQRPPHESRLSTRRSRVARTSRSQPARRARRFARRQPRRGVLLLVVLSLLVLFLMIGTAFVITAKQSEKSAKSAHKAASRLSSEAAQTDLLEEVLRQVVRDTNNPSSSLRGHSLLGDMYGADVLKTRVLNAGWASPTVGGTDVTGGQMLELVLDDSFVVDGVGIPIDGYGNFFDVNNPPTPPPSRFSPYDNAYNGQVLTFLSGPAKGRSTRIVGFVPPNRLRVMNFQLEGGGLISNPGTQLSASRLLINGRPFSGTGFGFNRAAAADAPKLTLLEQLNLDTDATPLLGELALLPNNAFLNLSSLIGNKSRLWAVPSNNSSDAPNLFDGAGFLLSGAQLAAYGDSSNINHVSRRLELSRQIGPAGFGGSNESYDAVDFQNMALALIPGAQQLAETNVTVARLADPALGTPLGPVFPLPSTLSTVPAIPTDPAIPLIIPSWHRPELVNYWANRLPIDTNSPFNDSLRGSSFAGHALALRRVLMRPNWLDHPNFTGSNPEFASIPSGIAGWGQKLARMVYGPWDVDNDNDGVRDSIWVDVGLPVMAGPNGKLVKPLAAILIVDMDGRLNVNAHGTCDLAEAWPANGSETGLTALTETTLLADPAGALRSDVMPQGVGYGPAEISLRWAITPENFRRVLTGETVGGKFIPGRYGFRDGGTIRPGQVNQFDYLSQINMNGWPDRANVLSNFGTPPDLRARYSVGLNKIGQAIFESTLANVINPTSTSDDLIVDSPYELNLSQKTAAGIQGYEGLGSSSDAPFSIAELERVLRVYDVDAGALPSRLAGLAGVQGPSGDPRRRLKLTTDSYDVPAPNVSLPHEMETLVTSDPLLKRQPKSAAELMEIRVRAALFPGVNAKKFPLPLTAVNGGVTDADTVRAIVRRLLAPELANGTRLNLNRPFGNGRDDNNNGVVDEPGEFEDLNNNGRFDAGTDRRETDVWKNLSGGSRPASLGDFATPRFPQLAVEIQPDASNPNGKVGVVDHRHLMARHLYALALTLTAEADFGTRPPTAEDQEFARRIAQWAVNAVDFRDPDNIMTPFEYDVNPFDGWDVDGFVGAHPGPDGILGTADDVESLDGDGKRASQLGDRSGQTLGPDVRGLVWGVERPELVMTETLAWHDRRTDDTASEDVYTGNGQFESTVNASLFDPNPLNPDGDKDFDQLVQPRGAFFVELYNPWAPNPAANADTHRRVNKNDLGVDLALTSFDPDPVDPAKPNSPVWRMAVAKRTVGNQSILEADAAQWDPDHPDDQLRPYKTHDIKFDRTIYFSGMPGNDSYQGAAYHDNIDSTRNMRAPSVRPGRYMIVGSGKQIDAGVFETPIADRKGARNLNQRKPQRRIELVTDMAAGPDLANRVRVLDCIADPVAARLRDPAGQYSLQSPADDGTLLPRVPGDTAPIQSMSDVVIIDMVSVNGQNSVRRRLSVTEPAIGYPIKVGEATWNPETENYEAQGSSRALDVPLDGPLGGQAALDNQRIDWPYKYPIDPVLTHIRGPQPQDSPDEPRGDQGAFYAHVYLQRLANPLLPWNPEPGHPDHRPTKPVNPYLTVDTMPTNVSVFNSRGDDSGREEPYPGKTVGQAANDPINHFSSVQRGFTAKEHRNGDANFIPSFWSREAPSLVRNRPGKAAQDMLTPPKNRYNRMRLDREDDNWFNGIPTNTLGFLNHALQDQQPAAVGVARQVVPDQTKTFEWMTWNNRPFVSGNEMLLVPRLRSSQLTQQFSNAENGAAGWSEYELPVSPEPTPQGGAQPITPFRHMAGFFYEEKDGNPPVAPPAGVPMHLYRILEYVHTPSLFVGAETWTNPQTFSMNLTFPITAGSGTELDPRITMRPPFNVVSEFREPGRINLNTIPINTVKDQRDDIWNGLFHGDTRRDTSGAGIHPGPRKDEFFASRRGYGAVDNGNPLLDANMPTMFANPFRAPDSGTFVPLPQMVRKGVDLGLLRSDKPTVTGPGDGAVPLFTADSTTSYSNTKRNPFFRYQPITRLDNLTTTRSNVYAVWVTIGFFEVSEVPDWNTAPATDLKKDNFNNDINLYKRVYPDGYAFGREDGVDVGNVRRLRGFYMIDRTKMAGFEPGADHNIENTVRLRRRIE